MVLRVNSIAAWKHLKQTQLVGKRIGFVPTMGNLHQGHMSLCHQSAKDNDITVVSIYVNPTQFNDSQDLAKYPRTLEQDIALLTQLGVVDYCLVLDDQEMYADDFTYRVTEHQFSLDMEGAFRPGHFTGMLSIVLKLLLAVAPQKAYFGEKDYQQYRLIQGMKQAFFMDCEIVPCPTIRESSGLPFSSRNSRLSIEERLLADNLAGVFLQKAHALDTIKANILALGIEIDYLQEFEGRRFIAVRIGSIRVLDNYALERP